VGLQSKESNFDEFKSGVPHGKHIVTTLKLVAISRWPVAGSSGYVEHSDLYPAIRQLKTLQLFIAVGNVTYTHTSYQCAVMK
jgi:hypothetical protein